MDTRWLCACDTFSFIGIVQFFFFGLLLLPLKTYKFIQIHNKKFSGFMCINWCSFLVIPADGIDLLLQFGLQMTKKFLKIFSTY